MENPNLEKPWGWEAEKQSTVTSVFTKLEQKDYKELKMVMYIFVMIKMNWFRPSALYISCDV